MKIALANESFSPQFDGVAVCVQNYAKIIEEKYGSACVIVPKDKARDTASFPYKVIEFPSTKPTIAQQYKIGIPMYHKLSKILDECPVELIHSHCPFISGILAHKIAKKRNVPHVSTFHSKYKEEVDQRLKMHFDLPGELVAKYLTSFYDKCDYVWTVSRGTAATLKSYGYEGKILIMPNGCDIPITYRDDTVRKQIAQKYHLNPDCPIFLFVGRLTYMKNIYLIVKALSALKKRDAAFSMLFVGSGEDEQKLKKLVSKLNLDCCIKFAGTVLDRQHLCSIYASSDLLVFPSVHDNAPLVVREAAACGCPSLLVKGSNSAENVIDGQNGILTGKKTADIALGIYDALHRHNLGEMGASARDTIYMSWDDVLERATAEYAAILHEWNIASPRQSKSALAD